MDDWKLPWEGGCRCGEVRIRVTLAPLLTGACHCLGCRKMSASACSLTVTVPAEGFEVTQGEPVLGGAMGPVSHHHHCPSCKSWLFTRAEGFDWFVNLRAPVLDDHRWFVPFVHLFTAEKLPWFETPAERSYAGSPDMAEFEPLMRAFAEQGARP